MQKQRFRILELGGYAAGYAGRLFVAAGADVVRVDGRAPPAWVPREAMDLYLHRGKRHVAAPTAEVLNRLVAAADLVVVEAENDAALRETGFDSWVQTPSVSITSFGRTGPRRNWRATPATVLAMGGQTVISGDADRAPLTIPGHYLEFQAGTLAFVGGSASLREGTGRGADISMLEVAMSLTQFSFSRFQCMGEERTRHGDEHHYLTPMNTYDCSDGAVYVNVVPAFWEAFTIFIGRPELLLDERFSTNAGRCQHRDALNQITAEALAGLSRSEVMVRAEEARIPVGMVLTFEEVLRDPQLAQRGVWETVEDEQGRSIAVPRVPYGRARSA